MAEGAGVLLLGGPAANAMSVVSMIASAPADHASLAIRNLISLALKTGLVDAVFANGAVFHGHIPAPQRHCIPLFDFNALIDLHCNYSI